MPSRGTLAAAGQRLGVDASTVFRALQRLERGLGRPLFLAEGRRDVLRLTPPLDECDTELWLLTHPESRHLRRVATVYTHLAQTLTLP